jgi:cytochrome c oxidase assembly protein subunit 15
VPAASDRGVARGRSRGAGKAIGRGSPSVGREPSTHSLQAFAWLTALGLFAVVLMGSLVTDTGSGRGCGGSWPLCRGSVLPSPTLHALVEYGHRAVAAAVALMVAILAAWAWRSAGRRAEVRLLSLVGVFFVVLQGLLGAAAVVWPQSPGALALHFGFSLLSLAGVVLLATVLPRPAAPERPAPHDPTPADAVAPARGTGRRIGAWAWVTLAWVYGTIYLGAYVAHTHAALACPGWPLCGRALPGAGPAVAVQAGHRLAAAGAVILVAGLYLQARRPSAGRPDLRRASGLALGLLALQALAGGLVVLSRVSLAALLLHQALASGLFATLAYVALRALPGRRRWTQAAGT